MGAIAAKSAEQTLLETVPINLLSTYQKHGRIRIHRTTYVWTTGNIGSGSTITGTVLPKMARIVGGFLASQAGASSHTLQVSINGVNLAAALAVGAATALQLLPDKDNFTTVEGVDFGGYAPVITSGGADAVVGNKVDLELYYVAD